MNESIPIFQNYIASGDEIWSYYKAPETQSLSRPDTKRWGVQTFRTYPFTREDLRAHEDSFVIARIDASQIDLVQYALRIGYLLCDTLTYWKGSTDVKPHPLEGYTMRPLEEKDQWRIDQLAREAFQGYKGHYFNDPRTQSQSTDVYVEWAQSLHDGVVILKDGYIVAFGQFSEPCELTLGGVTEKHNGKGLYTAFATACAHWGRQRGVDTIVISTQITNLAVQNVWAKLGLKPYKHVYTLHRWP